MYLYDLVLRQQDNAFFTEGGLDFTEADLTKWWTDNYDKTKAGVLNDPKKAEQVKPPSRTSHASATRCRPEAGAARPGPTR